METTPLTSNDPPAIADQDLEQSLGQLLEQLLEQHRQQCNDCGACRHHCAFLQQNGTPGQIASNYLQQDATLPFECNLCGLCNAQCPEELSIKEMFLQMRRVAVATQPQHLKRFGGLRRYERIGMSDKFSCYALPAECQSVFFPGCALPGSRPQQTWNLYRHLQQQIPNLGMVLDCCTKPSHDLGDQQLFKIKFGQLVDNLQRSGIKQILTACPNCYQVFKTYAPDFELLTVYQQLAQGGAPRNITCKGTITIHDPCVNRFEPQIHTAVRDLLQHAGMQIEEMPNHGSSAFCCGEGGCVMATNRHLALNWQQLRARQSQQRLITTYCAGCVEFLSPVADTVHILDLLFDPLAAMEHKGKKVGSLKRYYNRLRLKKRLQTDLPNTGVRSMAIPTTKPIWPKLMLLVGLITIIGALKFSGISAMLQPQQLQSWISGYGLLAPLVFVVLYSIAPALFLPGLPLTILGGILFGPIWGVVYTIIGATIGASLAFLIARYTARDWISSKLTAPRWQKLDNDVAEQGWKMVAFTRLIPLFPFNLLNYAFGLTNIKFSHYVITSFVCMLPATIAFISLSSSLSQLLKGQISPEFIIGVVLIGGLSLLPIWWKKRKGK